jgi:hypothetical protein
LEQIRHCRGFGTTGGLALFEPIRQRASKRWDQLENDSELAGPWHQLVKQVQSPRHILSELLQNADDAGAILSDIDGEPISISGQELLLMWEREEITLFPASYRLVYEND